MSKTDMSNDANHMAAFAQELCVPLPPLLTSHTTQWQTIVRGYMHQPAYEFPKVCLPWHGIGIFTNSALATIANLSPHYFTRLFKQSTAFTPHQFVLRCRVEWAKTLLINGKDSIAAIAQSVGFANQAHLNVQIKRLLGVPPKMILNQRKNRSNKAKT